MCGLAGVAGNLNQRHIAAFEQLMYMNVLRGSDASGVVGMGQDWNAQIIKQIGPFFSALAESRKFHTIVNTSKNVLIGHCRAGTVGGNKPSNAHPFRAGNVIGAHNGTLDWATKSKLTRAMGGITWDTDSETLFNHIDEFGLEETIRECEGAWALVFIKQQVDKDGNVTGATLNFLRNSGRPLHIFINEDRSFMAWASEMYMLKSCLARNDVDFVTKGKFELLPENMHWEFDIPARIMQAWDEPRVQKIEGFKKPPVDKTTFPQQAGKEYNDWWQTHYGQANHGSRWPSNVSSKEADLYSKVSMEETGADSKVVRSVPFGGEGVSTPASAKSNEGRVELPFSGGEGDSVSPISGGKPSGRGGVSGRLSPKQPHPHAINPVTNQLMTMTEFFDYTKRGCAACDRTSMTYQSLRLGRYKSVAFFDATTQKVGVEIYCESCCDLPEVKALECA